MGGVGVLGLVSAYRMTQLSLLAPFEYFGIPFALLLGWWFFAEAPLERLVSRCFCHCCRWSCDYLASGKTEYKSYSTFMIVGSVVSIVNDRQNIAKLRWNY